MDPSGLPRLMGRAREMAQLRGCLARLDAGLGTLLLVVGEDGMGKTRLAVEAVGLAASRPVAAGWGHGRPDGATTTLVPWAEALADAGVADLRALAEATAGGDRRAVFDKVVERLRRAAPVVVVLDDVDAADDASLALLGRVADELPQLPLVVVATFRPGSPAGRAPLGRLLRQVSDDAACDFLELEPLAVEAAIDCAQAMAGRRLDPERVIAVVARSGGNPFLIGELVRATADGVETSLPRTAEGVLADRLASVGPEARHALEGLAVLGGEAGPVTLAGVAGTTAEALMGALGPALAAHLVESTEGLDPPVGDSDGPPARSPVRFTHALVRDAVVAGLSSDVEAAAHRRALDVLRSAALPDPAARAEAMAHHALAAVLGGEPVDDDLIPLVLDAGRWCVRRAGPENAAKLFARALTTPAGAVGRAELSVARGEALLAAGETGAARSAFEDALDAAGPDADLAARARSGILACVAATQAAP